MDVIGVDAEGVTERSRRGDRRGLVRRVRIRTAALSIVAAAAVACSSDRPLPTVSPTTVSTPATVATSSSPPTIPADPVSGVAPSPALAAALDPVWARAPGGCLAVVRNGMLVYERGSDVTVVPASTVKVAAAAAAIVGLGAETRLRTIVAASAGPDGGVVGGDLWLIGGGDPVLGTDAWAATMLGPDDPRTSLDALADSIVAGGVRRVAGGVVGDDSRFDRQRYVRSWPERLIRDGEMGPLSALSVNDGFRVWGHPGVPFDDPPAEAAAIFTDLLRARGVDVGAPARSGDASSGAVALAEIASPPVGDLAAAMLRDSDNGTAELLLKELGRVRRKDGSTDGGLAAVDEVLEARGVRRGATVLGDASGLSDLNRVGCRYLVSVLVAFRPELDGRLAVAGRSGTLRRRLVGTPAAGRLRAKTGSLDGVTTLAGYADGLDGTTSTFALLVTGWPDEASGAPVQDPVVLALVTTP